MLGLVAGALWAAAGCAPTMPAPPTTLSDERGEAVNQGPEALVPTEAELLIVIDVAQLRSSTWTRAAVESAAPTERSAKAASKGFDELADLDRLVLAKLPGA